MKYWKMIAIVAVVVLALVVIGGAAVLAQDDGPATTPATGPVDEDGDGLCDNCPMPGEMMGPGMMDPGGMMGPGMKGRGMMEPGMMGRGMMHGRMGGWMERMMDWLDGQNLEVRSLVAIAAEALGMTEDEVRAELEAGQSIAEVAAAHGADVQTILSTALAERQAALDAAVEQGLLTQAQADAMLAHMTERLEARADQPWGPLYPPGRFGRGRGHCPFMDEGQGSPAEAGPAS
jgi:hypothetical protein